VVATVDKTPSLTRALAEQAARLRPLLAARGRVPGVARRRRLVSPMLQRVLLVNLVPLALLLAALLYLDQYQNGLLRAEVTTLREQGRIYAAALGEAAVREDGSGPAKLAPDMARPLLRRLTEPTPNAQARVYAPDGLLVADSRVREGVGGAVVTEPLPPPIERGPVVGTIGSAYDRILGLLPHAGGVPLLDTGPQAAGPDWQPDVKEELRLTGSDDKREMPPYIRRTMDNRLLVTVSEPVLRNGASVGILLLTREAREVDDSLLAVRLSILGLFTLALAITVALSWYLSLTIARPILNLAGAAAAMREGAGRSGAMPEGLLAREDEIGVLAAALAASARALWARMDAIERFAADVAHEIKNPLSSIRSAIETLRRIEDPEKQRRLLAIIAEDVGRLDRLISDISDASRIDAELSRVATEVVDLRPILATLAEIHESTRDEAGPRIELDAVDAPLAVQGVEGRLVQVLRNLLGNAVSFSPPGGRIMLRARLDGGSIEIAVEDEGPGIPEARLEHIFDRFYSERPKDERFGQHSGLGLSITRQIVEALHGSVTAENRRDAEGRVLGARFLVRLPRA
jgi:two-component system sensor histidine kinase ChvG